MTAAPDRLACTSPVNSKGAPRTASSTGTICFLIMLNGGMTDQGVCPPTRIGQEYRLVLDTASSALEQPALMNAGDAVTVKGFCVVVARVESVE